MLRKLRILVLLLVLLFVGLNTSQGFCEPDRQPLYPQRFAELMGGRIPFSTAESEIPRSLDQVRIGPLTAAEIGWERP